MKNRKLNIISLFSIITLISLIIKLNHAPGGMILSALYFGVIIITFILLLCLLLTFLVKLVFPKYSSITVYGSTTLICFLIFHYYLYSPTLKIEVSEGYSGEVCLVLSNVDENILKIDTNGVGYINQWTFNHNYNMPIVTDKNGKSLNSQCVGFSKSNFWGNSKTCCLNGKEISSLNFEIVAKNQKERSYNSRDLTKIVNPSLVKFE